jgi:spoIIIJ-associated protein
MRDLVFIGPTVPEVVAVAADTLGRAPATLRYVVLESGVPASGRAPAIPARIVVLADEATDGGGPTGPSPAAGKPLSRRLADVAAQLTRALGTTVTLALEAQEDGERAITLTAAEADPGLWGQTGEVFRALEHLLKRIASGEDGERPPRVVCREYRSWRDAQLQEQALTLASAVAQDHEARAFSKLNAYERRIVHLALAGRDDVGTRSVGEGEDRELLIEPRAVQ